MAIVLEPPEWRKKKGVRRHLADAQAAIKSAIRSAWLRVWNESKQHARTELALGGGFMIAVLLGVEPPGITNLPLVVAALLTPGVILAGAFFVSFLVALLWAPFSDHRKIVWERDFREHQVRTVHIRHHADNWLRWSRNELQNTSPQGQRTYPGYFDAQRVLEMIDYVARIRKYLADWGQPKLADELPGVSIDRVSTVEDYRRELERCQTLFLGWRSCPELPPFSDDANDDGLRLPMLYMP